ncbi:hypothetical protein [Paenibacillus andongensis]|uniref:hypothetical protein n=1 Tax=Paenibacillus andongensis TaxID=2975482 RepID=UPI0021BA78C1|nr:hypothetical protein [Paenibacillus andongensis]
MRIEKQSMLGLPDRGEKYVEVEKCAPLLGGLIEMLYFLQQLDRLLGISQQLL